MRTLIVSFDKDFPIKTAGNLVVYSYDLVKDLIYEVSNEIAEYLESGLIGDKNTLLLEFEKDRPSQYNDFIKLLKSKLLNALSETNIPETLSLTFPEGYVEWLRYNTKPQFVEIGKTILENKPILQIKPREIYEDYIQGTVIPAIDKLIGEFSDILTYTITDINDNNFQLSKEIKDLHPSLHFLPFYKGKIQREIGLAYYNGTGTVQNLKNAFHYFEKGAEDGDPDALCYVGIFYENGQIIEQDFTKAFNYYRASQRAGSLIGSAYLGHAYQKGIGTKNLLNLSIKYYIPSADAGILMAQENLGDIYYEGLNGYVRYDKAYEIYSRIKNKPNARTSYRLGKILYEGLAGSKNELEALKYLKVAACENIEDACFLCGKILEKKESEIHDEKEPYQYYKQGADKGDYKSATEYAIYLKNKNETSEIESLLKLGVEKGYAKAQYELALYLTEILNENFSDSIEESRDEVLSLAIAQQYQPAIDLNKKIKQQKEIQKQKELEEEEKRKAEETLIKKRLEEEKENEAYYIKRIVHEFILKAQTEYAIFLLKNGQTGKDYRLAMELLIDPCREGYPYANAWFSFYSAVASNSPSICFSYLESSLSLNDESGIYLDFYGDDNIIQKKKNENIIKENERTIKQYFQHKWNVSIRINDFINTSVNIQNLLDDERLMMICCYLNSIGTDFSLEKAINYFQQTKLYNELLDVNKEDTYCNYKFLDCIGIQFVKDLILIKDIKNLESLGLINHIDIIDTYIKLRAEKNIYYTPKFKHADKGYAIFHDDKGPYLDYDYWEKKQKEEKEQKNKIIEEFIIKAQTDGAILRIYRYRNKALEILKAIKMLVVPVEKGYPYAKAYMGLLQLLINPGNKAAFNLIKSSSSENDPSGIYNDFLGKDKELKNKNEQIIRANSSCIKKLYDSRWDGNITINGHFRLRYDSDFHYDECNIILGYCYLKGLGCEKSIVKALKCFDRCKRLNEFTKEANFNSTFNNHESNWFINDSALFDSYRITDIIDRGRDREHNNFTSMPYVQLAHFHEGLRKIKELLEDLREVKKVKSINDSDIEQMYKKKLKNWVPCDIILPEMSGTYQRVEESNKHFYFVTDECPSKLQKKIYRFIIKSVRYYIKIEKIFLKYLNKVRL